MYKLSWSTKLLYGILSNSYIHSHTVQRKFARFISKSAYGYYPFLYPWMFVSDIVGLDTLITTLYACIALLLAAEQ